MTRKLHHLLGALVVLGIAWPISAVWAQEVPVPLPEPVGVRADMTVLTIERPVAHETVQTPFMVEGRAPRGARLELWIGEQLVRAFQADAEGRFTAPVAVEVPADTQLFIHEVDAEGRRLQSASVTVNWSGERREREAPKSEAPPTTASGAPDAIPRTADADFETLELAPTPPPVEKNAVPAATEPAVATVETDHVHEPKPLPRGVRAFAEAGGGFGVGVASASILGAIGLAAGLMADPGSFAALGTMVIGGVAGYAVGIGVGVTAVGYALDGNGKVWAVILGELGGIAAGLLVSGASVGLAPNGTGSVAVISMMTLPIVGAVLGFELTSDASRRATKESSTALVPFVAPGHDGRWAAGPAFRVTF